MITSVLKMQLLISSLSEVQVSAFLISSHVYELLNEYMAIVRAERRVSYWASAKLHEEKDLYRSQKSKQSSDR